MRLGAAEQPMIVHQAKRLMHEGTVLSVAARFLCMQKPEPGDLFHSVL